MLLFFATAAATLPLELHTTPGAQVDVLPSVVRGRADVVIHDNRADLHGQVAWTVDTGVARARAQDLAGDWLLTLEMADPDTTVVAEPAGDGWRLFAVARPVDAPATFGPPDLVGALAGRLDRTVCAASALPISPLVGRDARWAGAATSHVPRLPQWSAAEPSVVSWADFDDTRHLLRAGADRPRTLYRLGAIARDLGHHREAAYYFAEAAAAGAPPEAHYQAARAQLATQSWAAAEASARHGVDAGGAPEVAVEVLAAVQLATVGPDGAGYGRVLVASAVSPEAQLLGGVLLAQGGCVVEARAAYARAARFTDGPRRELARLLLADSYLFAGDLAAAAEALASVRGVALDAETRRVLRGRTRLLSMLHDAPGRWASYLPDASRDAELPGEAGAEALYVLAQLYAHLGEERESLEAYASLVRRYPRLGDGPLADRYAAAWSARMGRMLDEGRTLDALALHRATWSPELAARLDDVDLLRRIAMRYAETGLRGHALAVWREIADIERTRGWDGRDSVRSLARLYVETGNYEDAMDAVQWLRRQRPDAEAAGEYALLEGRAALLAGDPDRARRAWADAARAPSHAVEARARVALLDARDGHCEAATAPLQEAAAAAPIPDVSDLLVREALVRCLLAAGRTEEATVEATRVAGLATDPTTRDIATWRAARLEADTDAPPTPLLADAAAASPGIWGALAREEAAQRSFSAQARPHRRP